MPPAVSAVLLLCASLLCASLCASAASAHANMHQQPDHPLRVSYRALQQDAHESTRTHLRVEPTSEVCAVSPSPWGRSPFVYQKKDARERETRKHDDASKDSATQTVTQTVPDELIVRFEGYDSHDAHRERLEAVRASPDEFAWVDRNNPGRYLPTDFAVVRVPPSKATQLMATLILLPFVKGVHSNRRLTRHLRWSEQDNADHHRAEKSPGRLRTKSSYQVHREAKAADEKKRQQQQQQRRRQKGSTGDSSYFSSSSSTIRSGVSASLEMAASNVTDTDATVLLNRRQRRRRLMQYGGGGVAERCQAKDLWGRGFSGRGVRMGVFDTGVRADHPHFRRVKDRSNWTHENTLNDGLGHGSFVAGVVASQDPACHGFAPDVELHAFRVFTNDQVSYTSWFLDAFNYAIATEVHIVNLSIGGPDYLDDPFVSKVLEVTSAGIIMVSAIGNDGPLYGTLNNPADQNDVIGVGGIDYADNIASFSSRGMSTWELPRGYGRFKPDIVAYGRDVTGSKIQGGCRTLSGTSVASPVVAGAVCLLASTVPEETRWQILNPASMKQALVEGAQRVRGRDAHAYVQGQGKLDVLKSANVLKRYKPRASVVPAALDLTECPYMWPHCKTPVYADRMPLIVNTTVLNGMALTGVFENPPVFESSNAGGAMLDVTFEYSELLWPWSGYLALYIRVKDEGSTFEGRASGSVTFTIVSPPSSGSTPNKVQKSTVKMPLTVRIIATPPREKRVLFSMWHSIRYPPGYIPRDNLDVRADILDWHGDHPHTNYHGLFNHLVDRGFHVEHLGSPGTCFNARSYSALILADTEEEFYPEEVEKLRRDVVEDKLDLIVLAEWFNVEQMRRLRFYDDNTRSWWTPPVGGGNVPALNDLLAPHGIALSDHVVHGSNWQPDGYNGGRFCFCSGSALLKFPKHGTVHTIANVATKAGTAPTYSSNPTFRMNGVPVLGLYRSRSVMVGPDEADGDGGLITVLGDANCIDYSHQQGECYGLISQILETGSGLRLGNLPEDKKAILRGNGQSSFKLSEDIGVDQALPTRREDDATLAEFSSVLGKPMWCGPDAQGTHAAGVSKRLTGIDAIRKVFDERKVDHFVKTSGAVKHDTPAEAKEAPRPSGKDAPKPSGASSSDLSSSSSSSSSASQTSDGAAHPDAASAGAGQDVRLVEKKTLEENSETSGSPMDDLGSQLIASRALGVIGGLMLLAVSRSLSSRRMRVNSGASRRREDDIASPVRGGRKAVRRSVLV
ncbi:membrane-bound transcription factor site-1 protease [Pseudoscourfieldia marina]